VLTNPSLLTVAVTNATGFVGINQGTPQAVGFGVTVDDFAVAIVSPANDGSQTSAPSWVALSGSVSNASFVGGGDFTATASSLLVAANIPAGDDTYVDFSALPAAASRCRQRAGAGLSTPVLRASGTVNDACHPSRSRSFFREVAALGGFDQSATAQGVECGSPSARPSTCASPAAPARSQRDRDGHHEAFVAAARVAHGRRFANVVIATATVAFNDTGVDYSGGMRSTSPSTA
jgi:hypothetical protein